MGARPSLIPWVCSFLTERTLQVRYKDKLSMNLTTSAGVYQDTRLGPLIFLTVVNDALQTSDCQRWKYVDDLIVAETRRVNSPCNLDTTLSSSEQWCEESNMRLNPTEIKLLDQLIPESQQVKLIGVIVSNNLRWTGALKNLKICTPQKKLINVLVTWYRSKKGEKDLCRGFATKLLKNIHRWLPESQSSNRQLRHSSRLRELKCRTERYKNSAIPKILKLLISNAEKPEHTK